MSAHLSQIAEAVTRSRAKLSVDLAESLEGIKVSGTKILDVREMTIPWKDSELTVQRVYVDAPDSRELKSVGWVVNDGIGCCLICSRKFSSFFWKHHCRTCGLIMCSNCTAGKFLIENITDIGSQKMCNSCNSTKDKTVTLKENTQWGKSTISAILNKDSANAMEPVHGVALQTTGFAVAAATPSRPASIREQATPTDAMAGIPGGSSKPSPINELWTYGAVRIRQVFPAFLFQASREDRSIVFVNVCSSEHVPRRDSHEDALYLAVGDKGVTEDGQSIYTVVVHPSVTNKFQDSTTSPTVRREVCEQILLALMRVNLESQFSIFYILPDSHTYKERVQSDVDKDALEMDLMTLKATTSEEQWAASTASAEPIVVAVLPSVAAFFHMRQVYANRNDLTRPGEKLAGQWNKYSHIVMDTDGTLTSTSSAPISHKGSAFSIFCSPSKSRSSSLVEYTRPSELRVEMRKQGVKVLVRGTISIPVQTGYSIQAPSTVPDYDIDGTSSVSNSSAQDEGTNTDLEEESQSGAAAAGGGGVPTAARMVVINVLHHQVIDDLIAMGVVKGEGSEPALLLCDAPVSMTRPNGRACKVYNLAVATGYLKRGGDVVGGKLTDTRISQIISKVNKHFHETADESQFVVTPVDATFGNNKAGVAPPPGKATKPGDLRSERHVTLVLYEYVHQTSATPGSKGALTKMASFSSQNSLASHSSFSFGDQQEEVFVGFTAAVPPTTSAKLTVGSASFKAPLPPATGAVAAVGATGEKSKEQGVPPRSAKMEHSRSWRAATPPILTTEGGGGGGGATVVGGRPQMERRRSVGAIVSSTPAKSSGKPFSVAPTPDTQDGAKKGWLTRQLSAKKN